MRHVSNTIKTQFHLYFVAIVIVSLSPTQIRRGDVVQCFNDPINARLLLFSTYETLRRRNSVFIILFIGFQLRFEINQKLEEAIPVKYPAGIYEAVRYSVLAKGAKRAPLVMCVAACELVGGDRLAAFPTACALEMVYAASLIHDDLPCMDDDPVRRGKPSNHTVYGADMAILAGDALFPLGFQHIVSHTPPHLVPRATILSVIAEIVRTVGSTGMAAGEYMDLEGGPFPLFFVQEKKFGAMGECSAVCGGLLGGATEDELESLRRYGRAVGMLYQVVDDSNKKKNLGAMEMAEELSGKAKKELQVFDKYGDSVVPLYTFVDYAAHRHFLLPV